MTPEELTRYCLSNKISDAYAYMVGDELIPDFSRNEKYARAPVDILQDWRTINTRLGIDNLSAPDATLESACDYIAKHDLPKYKEYILRGGTWEMTDVDTCKREIGQMPQMDLDAFSLICCLRGELQVSLHRMIYTSGVSDSMKRSSKRLIDLMTSFASLSLVEDLFLALENVMEEAK